MSLPNTGDIETKAEAVCKVFRDDSVGCCPCLS